MKDDNSWSNLEIFPEGQHHSLHVGDMAENQFGLFPVIRDPEQRRLATNAWRRAWDAAGAAAGAAARAAARDAARDAAWNAAWAGAGEALEPTVQQLQQSAVLLVKRMCEVGR